MSKSNNPASKGKPLPSNKNLPVFFDYNAFKEKHYRKLFYISIVLAVVLLISLFKNISYPLFWADESMTAIGAERVIKFGYPKVHDGKNVFYDLIYTNDTLGINEKDDAYIGGTNWGHYYFGVIGYKLAESADNIYVKTGLFRATFAFMGLTGLGLFCFFMSGFFKDKFPRFGFVSLFLFLELFSVPLVLHLRELRYYSLAMFLILLIVSLYVRYRFLKPFNKVIFISILSITFWLLFNTFAPSYFALILTIALSEAVHATYLIKKTRMFQRSLKGILVPLVPIFISFTGIIPLLSYYKTFEISSALNAYYNFNLSMYLRHITDSIMYFVKFELLLLALVLKIILLAFRKAIKAGDIPLVNTSYFMALFFVVFIAVVSKVPNPMYTRYLIYLQPVLAAMIIFDFFILLTSFSTKSKRLLNNYTALLIAVFTGLFINTLSNNFVYLKGHVYELTHQYKGPLDYMIPYIKQKFPKTDTMTIATNYEETSFMYYLGSKVIVGFVGNNIAADSLLSPAIIAFRKPWRNAFPSVFNGFLRKVAYRRISFPVMDPGINNVPELNHSDYLPWHKFYFLGTDNEDEKTDLYIKKDLIQVQNER